MGGERVSAIFFLMGGVEVSFIPGLMSVEMESRFTSACNESGGRSSSSLSSINVHRLDNVSSGGMFGQGSSMSGERIGGVLFLMSGIQVGLIPSFVSVEMKSWGTGGRRCSSSGISQFSGDERSSSSSGITSGSRSLKRAGIIVIKAKTSEGGSNVIISVSTGIVVGSQSRLVAGSDRLHGIIGSLMLTSRNIVEISGLIAHLVLRPSVSMISGIVRLDPAEAILDGISSFGSRKPRSHFSSKERSTSGITT